MSRMLSIRNMIWSVLAAVGVGAFFMFSSPQVATLAVNAWPFTTSSNYIVSSSTLAQVSGGLGSLVDLGGGTTTTVSTTVDNDNGAGEFGAGTLTGVQYVAGSSSLQLTAAGATGTFDSRIIDAGNTATWTTFAWMPDLPHVALPDGTNIETDYATGTIDGSDIVALWHMDEGTWDGTIDQVLDSSQNSYHAQARNGAVTVADGLYDRAGDFMSGSSQYLFVTTTEFEGSSTSGTVAAWVRPTGSSGAGQQIFSVGDTAAFYGRLVLGLTSNDEPIIYHARNNVDGAPDGYYTTSVGLTANQWNHIVWWSDGTTYRIYLNGTELALTDVFSANGSGRNGNWYGDLTVTTEHITIGAGVNNGGVNEPFDGEIDEVAVFGRPLDLAEVQNLYRRGATDLRFQIRSCDDNACVGESFVGPDGTTASYYTDTTSTLTTPTTTITNLIANRYFQYRAYLFASNTAYTPQLSAVTTTASITSGSSAYSTATPTIESATGFSFLTLTAFTETLGGSNAGTVEYQVAVNNTSTWYYHNGGSWTSASTGYPAHTNTAAEITTNAQTIDNDLGTGTFYWRAFLVSDGTQAVEIDNISVQTTSTLIFTSTTLSLAEGSATSSIQVQLDEASASTMTIDYAATGGTAVSTSVDFTLAAGTATLPPGATTGTFDIVIVDDVLVESSETIVLTLSNATGGLLGSTTTMTLTVTDNDTAGVAFTTTSLAVTEGGVTSSYGIALTSSPSSSVTIALSTTTGGLTISTTSIFFDSSNWNVTTTVTVTGTDDNAVEGTHTASIMHALTSADTNYNGLATSNVTTTITDNDTPGVTITTTTVAITEGGTVATYTIQLATQPSATVTISATSSDGQVSLSTTSIEFTTSNWNTPVIVTSTAVDDNYAEGAHVGEITHAAASGDGNYNGIAVDNVTTTITDNDSVAVQVNTSTISITESGTTATYTIQLVSQPTTTVTITPSTGDGESSVSPTSLNFTSSDWNVAQTITVTAVDDGDIEGTHTATITHAATQSTGSGQYNGVSVSSSNFTVTDNDVAGVTTTVTSLSLAEGGSNGTYTVVLSAAPTQTVYINLTTSSAEASISPTSLTFSSTTWNVAQTVTVSPVDDNYIDGSQTTTITHTVSTTDTNFGALPTIGVTTTVTDNDAAGITLTNNTVSYTEGSNGTYTVELATIPSTTVTVSLSASSGDATISTSSIDFTSTTWNSAVTVTVSTADDSTVNGTRTVTITHTVTSTDTDYHGTVTSTVTATIADNDSSSSGSSGGGGGGSSYVFSNSVTTYQVYTPETSGETTESVTETPASTEPSSGGGSSAPIIDSIVASGQSYAKLDVNVPEAAEIRVVVLGQEPFARRVPYDPEVVVNVCENLSTCRTNSYLVTVEFYNAAGDRIQVQDQILEVNRENIERPPYLLVKQTDDPKVYVVENGVRHWIPSEAAFFAAGYQWVEMLVLDSLDRYILGDPLPDVAPGTVIPRVVAPVSTPTADVTFTSFLDVGANSDEVLAMQQLMQTLGYFPADIAPNGNFGPATRQAVIDMQRANGIDPFGYVGPSTRAYLNSVAR